MSFPACVLSLVFLSAISSILTWISRIALVFMRSPFVLSMFVIMKVNDRGLLGFISEHIIHTSEWPNLILWWQALQLFQKVWQSTFFWVFNQIVYELEKCYHNLCVSHNHIFLFDSQVKRCIECQHPISTKWKKKLKKRQPKTSVDSSS